MFEKDPSGLDPHTPGAKLDEGKAPVTTFCLQYFPDALAAVAVVSELGAEKYSPFGWKRVEDGIVRYTDALGRHLGAEKDRDGYHIGTLDDNLRVSHAAQVAWNALARLQLMIEEGRVFIQPRPKGDEDGS